MQVGWKVFIYSRRASTTAKSGWQSSEALLAGLTVLTVLAPRKQRMPDLSNANDRRHLIQFSVCAYEDDFRDEYLSANRFKNAVFFFFFFFFFFSLSLSLSFSLSLSLSLSLSFFFFFEGVARASRASAWIRHWVTLPDATRADQSA